MGIALGLALLADPPYMADEPLPDEEGLFLPRVNGTAIADLGHSCAEVPKSPHIAAYPRVFLIGAV